MGVLVEIDISDLVWDDQTDGSYKYAVDRIDEFIDEISNKILPYDFKQVSDPVILIQLNSKLISHTQFNADGWDEDAMNLSLFLVLDFESAEDIIDSIMEEDDIDIKEFITSARLKISKNINEELNPFRVSA